MPERFVPDQADRDAVEAMMGFEQKTREQVTETVTDYLVELSFSNPQELLAAAERVEHLYWNGAARSRAWKFSVQHVDPFAIATLRALEYYPDRDKGLEVADHLRRSRSAAENQPLLHKSLLHSIGIGIEQVPGPETPVDTTPVNG